MSSDARTKFDFMRVHDGSQEPIEGVDAIKAAVKFKGMCEDVFLAHAADQRTFRGIPEYGMDPNASVSLVVDSEDGSRLGITVQTSGTELSEYTSPYTIFLQETTPDGFGRKLVRYDLSRDMKEVVRNDVSEDVKQSIQESPVKPLGRNSTVEEIYDHTQSAIEHISNELENDRLEQSMGLNRQVVGEQEIDDLLKLVNIAIIDKRY